MSGGGEVVQYRSLPEMAGIPAAKTVRDGQ